MDDIASIVFPPLSRVWLPQVTGMPALVDLGTFGAIDLSHEAARQRQRAHHLRTGARESVFILGAIEFMRAIRAVLTEAGNEIRLLGRLILRRVPIGETPEEAHHTQGPLEIEILDLFAHDFFSIERALLVLPIAKELKVVMERVVLSVLTSSRIEDRFG